MRVKGQLILSTDQSHHSSCVKTSSGPGAGNAVVKVVKLVGLWDKRDERWTVHVCVYLFTSFSTVAGSD